MISCERPWNLANSQAHLQPAYHEEAFLDMLRLHVQLAESLGKAFAYGAVSAATLIEIFSPTRLLPFRHLLFYNQLASLFTSAIKKAEDMTTPFTVKRLIETQQDPARNLTLVGHPLAHPFAVPIKAAQAEMSAQ